MGKTVTLIIAVLLVLVLGATLFAIQARHRREMTGLQLLLQKQEEELGILRADNAYLKSQTSEISVLEEDLTSKRAEIEALKKKEEEQHEMVTSFEERLTELERLQGQVDQLKQENDRLRLEAEKRAVDGLGSEVQEGKPSLETSGSQDELRTPPTTENENSTTLGKEETAASQSGNEPLTFPGEPTR